MAVAIDFVIVVVGVFVGIQVANWNDARNESAKLAAQLANQKSEMVENLARLESHRAWCQSQDDSSLVVRRALSENLADFDVEVLNAHLLTLQNIRTFVPELTTLEELADSGGLRRLNGTALISALTQWQAALAALRRIDDDALVHRNSMRSSYFSSSISMGALLEHYPGANPSIYPARFRNSMEALANDLELENFLALRSAFSAGITARLDELEVHTMAIISELRLTGESQS